MREMMTRQHIFILAIMALCSSIAQAVVIPKSGTFDIDGSSAQVFIPIPWVSSNPYLYTYLWPFAADALYEETEPGSKYNLAQMAFSAGSFTVTDYGEKSGNLGIRIANFTGSTQTFEPCVLILDFINTGNFSVYLPGFTFEANKNMFFWLSQSGATYYADSLKGAGYPDMSAATAMAAGDEYLARAPEPATVLLLGLGSLVLLRKRGV
jgi:hypothetical protein